MMQGHHFHALNPDVKTSHPDVALCPFSHLRRVVKTDAGSWQRIELIVQCLCKMMEQAGE